MAILIFSMAILKFVSRHHSEKDSDLDGNIISSGRYQLDFIIDFTDVCDRRRVKGQRFKCCAVVVLYCRNRK